MKDMKNGKNAAPWGTPNWIATFPYSRMDRKRRKRAERVVGEETVKDIFGGPSVAKLLPEYRRIAERYCGTLLFPKKLVDKVHKALRTLDDFEIVLLDKVFGHALAKAWGLDGKHPPRGLD